MQPLQGSFVALVTPMSPNGSLDFNALEALVEWHIEAGTNGIHRQWWSRQVPRGPYRKAKPTWTWNGVASMARGFTEVMSALFSRANRDNDKEILVQEQCLVCNSPLVDDKHYQIFRVCSECGFHYSISHNLWVFRLKDSGSNKHPVNHNLHH